MPEIQYDSIVFEHNFNESRMKKKNETELNSEKIPNINAQW